MKRYLLSMIVTLACLPVLLVAQKAPQRLAIEINPDVDQVSQLQNNMRVNTVTGTPYAIYQVNYETTSNDPALAAREYLQASVNTFDLARTNLTDLTEHAVRSGQAGHTVRFRQNFDGLPVNKNEITISMDHDMKVQFVANTYSRVNAMNTIPAITLESAKQEALSYLNVAVADLTFEQNQLMIYQNPNMTKLAYQFILHHPELPGEWEVLVDAVNSEIIKACDIAHYSNDDNGNTLSRRVNGTANVWNPDPLAPGNNTYGDPGFVDNNDNTSPQLDGAMVVKPLYDIDNSGGMHHLDGPYASIVDTEGPFFGLFSQVSPDFLFDRSDSEFEAVQCYFHIDTSMRYLNEVLNVTVDPIQYAGGARFDPHGLNGADNSHYTSGNGVVAFGEGCVDDGEDSDVIHHELGHAIHDWVTGGNLSQVNGLSEGSGDYWCVSYNRALGFWNSAQAPYFWVFNWDGHNVCWGGRTVNYGASYPGGLVGQVHQDGQIWSTSNMKIWDHIGPNQTDRAFWEGLAMTGGGTNQNDAANAVYQAAINMGYPCDEREDIHDEYSATGYTLPAFNCTGTPIAAFSATPTTVCLDVSNSVQFTDESTGGAVSWDWTFEGGTPGTSPDQNPLVTYDTPGAYDVTLEVDGGNTLTETDYITVEAVCVPGDCITVREDDLESYTLGSMLNQSPYWVPWTPGSAAESGEVTTEQANSGTQSIKLEGVPAGGPVDQLYLLGDQTTGGPWELTFWIYVPVGNSAYYNMQHFEVPGNEWAHDVFFHSDGDGVINADGNEAATFSYTQGEWIEVFQTIDQDLDVTTLTIEGNLVHTWAFATQGGGGVGTNQIGALDFFPFTDATGVDNDPNPAAIPLYYIDDVFFCGENYVEPAPANNECAGIINISSLLGGPVGSPQTGGPYDNTNATTEASDPADGWECYGALAPEPSLDNTLWFAFVGDGNTYDIITTDCGGGLANYIDDGDTQMSIYTGSCGALTPHACNEDAQIIPPNEYPAGFVGTETFYTEVGVTYYVMVDGFNFQGALSSGEYCIEITRIDDTGIEDVTATEFGLVSVSPNPATDQIQIELSNAQARELNISIMSINGQQVYSRIATSNAGTDIIPINVESLAAGMYILQMRDEQAVTNVKFIVE